MLLTAFIQASLIYPNMLIKHLLCARHCARLWVWGYNGKRLNSLFAQETYSLSYRPVEWSECLCSSKMLMLKSWLKSVPRWWYEEVRHLGDDRVMNGIGALIRGPRKNLLTPPIMWGYSEKSAARKGVLAWPCWHPDTRLPACRTARHKFLLFISYPVCDVLL